MRDIRPTSADPNLPDTTWQASHFETRRNPSGFVQDEGWGVLRKLWRRKWLVVGIVAVFGIAGGAASALMTPRYTAQARVLVGIQDPHVTNIEAVLKNVLPNTETTRSEAYIIASREMARKVGYRLALDKSPEFNPALEPKDEWWRPFMPSRLIDGVTGIFRSAKDAPPRDGRKPAASNPRCPDEGRADVGRDRGQIAQPARRGSLEPLARVGNLR